MTAKEMDFQIRRSVWLLALMQGCPVFPLSYSDRRDYENRPRTKTSKSHKPITDYKMDLNIPYADRDSWWNYYGGRAVPSQELIAKFTEDVNAGVGIDWNATEDMQDDHQSEFNGTYDDCRQVPIMWGILKMTNGNIYPWVVNLEINLNGLRDVLRLIAEYESKTDVEVMQEAVKRLKKL